jgi:hypothetical protein
MKIQNNFSEVHLLFSEPVEYSIYDEIKINILLAKFKIKLPTVRDLYFNSDLGFFLSFIKKTITDIKKQYNLEKAPIDSHVDFLNFLLASKNMNPTTGMVFNKMYKGFKFLCPEINYNDSNYMLSEICLNDELFENMKHIWLISIDSEPFSLNSQYIPVEQRKLEEKIRSIKNGGKNSKQTGGSKEFEKIYMTLTYEFGCSREDILNMTMYTVKTILKYTSKSINYKLTLAAKAYGNTKKVKFITDKGE